jgi:hypothetical protein
MQRASPSSPTCTCWRGIRARQRERRKSAQPGWLQPRALDPPGAWRFSHNETKTYENSRNEENQ